MHTIPKRIILFFVLAAASVFVLIVSLNRNKNPDQQGIASINQSSKTTIPKTSTSTSRAPSRPKRKVREEKDERGKTTLEANELESALPEINHPEGFRYIEFSEDDLLTAGSKVLIDVGDYTASVGEEIEITLTMAMPALTSLIVLIEYDGDFLEYVSDSAKGHGDSFANGIECYTDLEGDRMVIINSGLPGAKNIEAATGQPVATFRMRATRSGVTQLVFPEEKIDFTNALGDQEEYVIGGGRIEIN